MNADQALQVLLSAFPSQERGNADLTVTAYIFAIDGLPDQAISEAVKRFVRGEVESHNGRFMPTPAELARVARGIADRQSYQPTLSLEKRLDMARLHGLPATTFLTERERHAYKPPTFLPPSAQEMERRAENVRKLRESGILASGVSS